MELVTIFLFLFFATSWRSVGAAACGDEFPTCAALAERFGCTASVMTEKCRKSCKLCPAEFTRRPRDKTVSAGSDVLLRCGLTGLVAGRDHVTWRRVYPFSQVLFTQTTNTSDAVTNRLRVLSPVPGEFNLYLKDVRPADTGWYECAASYSLRATASLTVEGPFFIRRPVNTSVKAGSSVNLQCALDGLIPGENYVLWKRVSAPAGILFVGSTGFASKLSSRYSILRPSAGIFTLQITDAQLKDSGAFECSVTKTNLRSVAGLTVFGGNATVKAPTAIQGRTQTKQVAEPTTAKHAHVHTSSWKYVRTSSAKPVHASSTKTKDASSTNLVVASNTKPVHPSFASHGHVSASKLLHLSTSKPAPASTEVPSSDPPLRSIFTSVTSNKDLGVDCNFNQGLCGWSNVLSDDFDWSRRRGHTPSSNTGPSADRNGNDGHYLYIETSSPRKPGERARLRSPDVVFSSTQPRCLSLWAHMSGRDVGTLSILLQSIETGAHRSIFSVTGSQGASWRQFKVQLLGPSADRAIRKEYVVIEATSGNGYMGDIAIDDVKLLTEPCDTAQ